MKFIYVELYFIFFIFSATIFQIKSTIPPWIDRSPIEYFTSSLLWMLSLSTLLIATQRSKKSWKLYFWLAAVAGLSFLAIDEIFAIHELTEKHGIANDDHLKIFQFIFAGIALYIVTRIEHPPTKTKISFIFGYVFHALYIFTDLGDGDYFRVPVVSLEQLRWAEEFFELFTLTLYCIGFVYLLINKQKMNELDKKYSK